MTMHIDIRNDTNRYFTNKLKKGFERQIIRIFE